MEDDATPLPPDPHETAELRFGRRARESASGPPLPETAPRAIAGYELLEELGRGGMARVFRGRQLTTGREVAIKILHNQGPPSVEGRLRFQRETSAALRLQHPHIVRTLEGGIEGEDAYLVMEIVHGESLKQRLTRGPCEPRWALRLTEALAQALAFAHRNGVVHRDVKPANILIDEAGEPHLVDFGLAKPLHGVDDLTATGLVVGTPSYMAPEQASGRQAVGPLADLYALGATLYEMLTGRPPFASDRTLQILVSVIHDDPEPPSRVRPDLDPELDAIVLTALAKDPSDRYPSCESFAADLRRRLSDAPVVATPPCRTAKVERSIRGGTGLVVSDPRGFLGGFDPAYVDHAERLLAHFSSLLREISVAIVDDGHIDQEETRRIRAEWERLKGYAETFIGSCEEGLFTPRGGEGGDPPRDEPPREDVSR
ncbi:MAG: serine/threonine protein kinase [Planctomycetes bacterium]|nr:serine/threonine protein kinase [Planctomycetota bacterium]